MLHISMNGLTLATILIPMRWKIFVGFPRRCLVSSGIGKFAVDKNEMETVRPPLNMRPFGPPTSMNSLLHCQYQHMGIFTSLLHSFFLIPQGTRAKSHGSRPTHTIAREPMDDQG